MTTLPIRFWFALLLFVYACFGMHTFARLSPDKQKEMNQVLSFCITLGMVFVSLAIILHTFMPKVSFPAIGSRERWKQLPTAVLQGCIVLFIYTCLQIESYTKLDKEKRVLAEHLIPLICTVILSGCAVYVFVANSIPILTNRSYAYLIPYKTVPKIG